MPQSIKELQDRVEKMSKVFNDILNEILKNPNQIAENMRKQLITGINKAYGQAMGFKLEYDTAQKAKTKVYVTQQGNVVPRQVTTQVHADVTVGAADMLFAKSIECKSVTSPVKDAVNAQISKAIEQLGGQTGHTPLPGDVRIIDVMINGKNNPWPMPGGAYDKERDSQFLDTFETTARNEINALVHSANKGAKALRDWLTGQQFPNFQAAVRLSNLSTSVTNNLGQIQWVQLNPKSTRPIYQNNLNEIHKIRCLTVKIRYESAYPIKNKQNINIQHLSELVFQAYKNVGGQFVVEQVKRKLG